MAKPLKIFFIGRRHGVIPLKARPWKLENQRHGELDGLRSAKGIIRTYSPAQADVIFVRNKQEYTREKDIKNIDSRIQKFRSKKLILNDIEYFQNYNSKDITFSIWEKNNIPIPAFKTLNINVSEQYLVNEVIDFLALHPCMILRSTNDESGLGMFFLDSKMNHEQIVEKVRECKAYMTQNKGMRTDGRIMAVEYVGDCLSSQYQYLCRAYCVGPHIVTTRCITGKQHNVHAKSMVPDDFDEFLRMNTTVVPKFHKEPFRTQIIKAVESLGIRMTAIDFIYKDDAVFFLEVNPIWGGGYNFGNDEFRMLLREKRSTLENKIPHVYEMIDGAPFYKRFYETIGGYTRKFYS